MIFQLKKIIFNAKVLNSWNLEVIKLQFDRTSSTKGAKWQIVKFYRKLNWIKRLDPACGFLDRQRMTIQGRSVTATSWMTQGVDRSIDPEAENPPVTTKQLRLEVTRMHMNSHEFPSFTIFFFFIFIYFYFSLGSLSSFYSDDTGNLLFPAVVDIFLIPQLSVHCPPYAYLAYLTFFPLLHFSRFDQKLENENPADIKDYLF